MAVGVVAALVAAALLVSGGGAPALGAAPGCTLAPQLRDLTINQGLGSYTPLAWGKDTLLRLYMSQPSCAASGALIQVTGGTLTVAGGGGSRTISATTPALVSVYPALATYSTAPAVDSTGDVKFDVPGSTLSPAGSEAGFTATFTATINYVQQPNSRTPLAPGSVSFTVRPGTTTAITAPVAKKTNAFRVLVVPMGDPTKLYDTQLTAAGQQEIQRGMLTLARIFPLRDGIATLTDTSPAGLAAGLRYSISPTLLDVTASMSGGVFCGNATNFVTVRALLAQFLQAWNSANPGTPADRVLGVGDEHVTNGSLNGCDEGRAAINGNEAWVRLAYDTQSTPSNAGALMGMELAHTMGAVPAGRNDGAFHSLYTNSDYLPGDLNRAFNIATRSVLAGTSDDHTVMRLVSPWNNTNTVLEKADWGLLLCRLGGPVTSDCATAGTVGSAAAGPAFVISGTTDGTSGIPVGTVGTATPGTKIVESYFSTSATTLPDPASQYRLVQKANGTPLSNQGVPIATVDTHHNDDHGDPGSETDPGATLFSVALPFNTSADRIELWKGTPGATNSLLLYARNRTDPPVVTSETTGSPILLSLRQREEVENVGPLGVRVSKPARSTTHRRAFQVMSALSSALRNPLSVAAALTTSFVVNDTGDGGDSNTTDDLCKDASGKCTLRAAIQQANTTAGADTITFSIGTGPVTIQPGATALPQISEALVIDGTTQGGYTGAPLVELDGSASPGYGLASSGVVTIRGLVINRFPGSAIALFSGSGGSVVQGNYLGTNVAGDTAAGNAGLGVQVFSSGNTIGGANASDRNVISANDAGVFLSGGTNIVTGNYIGTDAAGTAALGNAGYGIGLQASSSNTITNNVISGTKPTNASGAGIDLYQSDTQSTNNVIQGNFIGTDKTGSIAIGNSRRGISLNGASNNTIGGSGPGQANVISGNTGDGIDLPSGQQNTIQGNLIGVAANGTSPLGNGGFGIQMNSSINAIGGLAAGEGNVIANNNGDGIVISGGTGNGVLGNRFYANAGLGINLGIDPVTANDAGDTDVGANNLQNFPVINSATLSGGTLHLVGTLDTNAGLANPAFRIEAFLNSACDPSGNGEGEFFAGAANVSVDGSGHAAFTLDLPTSATGTFATATATAFGTGDTSEFSACAAVTGGGGGGGGGGGLVVNSTNDVDDGTCNATHCSLREAINAANANAGADTITFGIGSAGSSQTIQPTSQLPTITAPVLLDGWSQGGSSYTGPPLIHLDGVNTGYPSSAAEGLAITGADSTVRGFRINRFSLNGIHISGSGATGNHIEGNWVDGASTGIQVSDAASNVIGGTTTAARNVVGGNSGHGIFMHNATNTTVQGNYVGTDVAGTTAIPNGIDGIAVDGGGNNTIGGTAAGAGNLASGNHNQGIAIFGVDFASTTGNVVRGNIVGTNPAGTSAIPNGTGVGDGVRMLNAINTTVVGNLISGNPNGVRINGAVSTGNTVQGNYIGTDVTGATAVPNTVGVLIENNAGANTIGGALAGQGNLISGNTSTGIALNQGTGIVIQGNSIGANATGSALGNGGNGIRLGSQTGGEIPTYIPATNTQVGGTAAGVSNLIANNGQAGVAVIAGQGNRILGNSINANGALGIDLAADGVTANDTGDPDLGSNGLQNFPIITAARSDGVSGTLNSASNATYRLEFFSNAACDASGNGEGKTFLGATNVTTNGSGNASFSFATPIVVGQYATATATDPANNTSEFSACKLVASAVPAGKEQSNTTATDDNADFDVLDLYLDCGIGKGKFPIALALKPGAGSDNAQANWTYNFDASLACEGGKLAANVNDGFAQSGFSNTGTAPIDSSQKSPFLAILSPAKGKTFLQYSAIPLKGIAVDPEDGALTPHWKLINNSNNEVVARADGTTKDLSPGTNGWAVAPGGSSYTVELTATDSASPSNTTTSTVSITILPDADNDGIPAATETGCLGSSDTNPMDAYGDNDLDGIPNVDDPEPCAPQNGPYTAVMTFQPNPFPIPSSGNTVNVTVQVPYRSLSQVLARSVAITKINGESFPLSSVSWKVANNVAQALFDRQAIVGYFTSHNIHNRNVVFTIIGSSNAPPWSFEGVATTFVAG